MCTLLGSKDCLGILFGSWKKDQQYNFGHHIVKKELYCYLKETKSWWKGHLFVSSVDDSESDSGYREAKKLKGKISLIWA